MGLQLKSLQLSLLIHGILLVFIAGGNALLPNTHPSITIDFDISRQKEEPPAAPPPPKPLPQKKIAKPLAAPVEKKKVEKVPEKQPEKPIEEIQRPEPAPVEKAMPVADVPAAPPSPSPITGVQNAASETGWGSSWGTGPRNSGAGVSAEKAKTIYLNKHLSHIRDRIVRNVSYPPAAARMEWEGTVLVSFVIKTDGTVKDIAVARSSRYRILDENAMETVRNSIPFPKPQVETLIKIPITYKLN